MWPDQRRLDSVDEMRALAAGHRRHATARPTATWQTVTSTTKMGSGHRQLDVRGHPHVLPQVTGGGLTAAMCIHTTIDALYSYRKLYVRVADYLLLLELCLMDTNIRFFERILSGYTLLLKIVYLFVVSIFPVVLTLKIVYYSEYLKTISMYKTSFS